MNIKIICIGKLKEKYWVDAANEYSKRLSKYCKLNLIELKESKLPSNPSKADEQNVIIKEGEDIARHIKPSEYIVTLEIEGELLSSEKLASKINTLSIDGINDITFIIGGSLGISEDVKKMTNYKLSFSNMTFTHQMIRVILLEQIYRSYKINRNESYHK
ncbi:MAG: 23S rRNA (pseudouridine(1915)-N(3))-methyltransferase RlmH [Clostridiales bacterium]|nr:23S rRNA (pseudouridine(1915)-N(3))-methyltransferase RlmH [Clostridiales bacterium]